MYSLEARRHLNVQGISTRGPFPPAVASALDPVILMINVDMHSNRGVSDIRNVVASAFATIQNDLALGGASGPVATRF
jgi:hypothetical protein